MRKLRKLLMVALVGLLLVAIAGAGGVVLPVPSLRHRSARVSPAGQLPPADRDQGLCRRRPPDAGVCPGEAGVRAGRGDAQAADPGLPRGRGQEFLQPSRDRPAEHRARGADQRRAAGHRPAAGRRLDHHPAGRQEFSAHQRGHARAQDQGSDAGVPHRAGVHQGPDPRAVSQPDLPRPRLLWRRGGGAQLLRQVARRAEHRRGRLPGRPAQGALLVSPDPPARGRQGPARLGDRAHGGSGRDQRRRRRTRRAPRPW